MKDYNYPIYFMCNRCVHCGTKGSLKEINQWGNANNNKTYPITKMRCSKCGREYFINWDQSEDGKFNQPIAVSNNIIDEFTTIFERMSFSEDLTD